MANEQTIKIKIDSSPALSLIQLVNSSLGFLKGPIEIPDFPTDIIRIEQYSLPANTDKIFIRLYPSDAFLRFAAAIFASHFNLGVIDDSSHNTSDIVTAGIDVQRDGFYANTSVHRKETL